MATVKSRSESPDIVILPGPPHVPSKLVAKDENVETKPSVDDMAVMFKQKSAELARREVEMAQLRSEMRKLQQVNRGLVEEQEAQKNTIRNLKTQLRQAKNASQSAASSSNAQRAASIVQKEVRVHRRGQTQPISVKRELSVEDADTQQDIAPEGNAGADLARSSGTPDGTRITPAIGDIRASMPPHDRNSSPIRQSREPSPPSRELVRSESPKADRIKVTVKAEDEEDDFRYVSFTKSEDGRLDLWDLSGFNLRPCIEVSPEKNVGFTRKVISDAFGGGHQACFHNWQGQKATRRPHLTFNREWNPQLPGLPGQHGTVLCGFNKFNDGTKVSMPIDFFVAERENWWVYKGTYSLKLWGEIEPTHLHLLPPSVVTKWIIGTLSSQWGKSWVEGSNEELREKCERTGRHFEPIEFSAPGLRKGLNEGSLIISFTIMECVGYRDDWFERLLYKKAHPDPPRKKRKASGKKTAPAKKAKTGRAGKVKKEEPAEELSEDENGQEVNRDGDDLGEARSDDDSDAEVDMRVVAALPKRQSQRIMAKGRSDYTYAAFERDSSVEVLE
ncbi:hypothetical protein PLICRDRAFT_27852 [Plicaturopsis crispa FD-325 SS-3]|nr:hypothetical protein PLICRDRAFT_27852 [Plicaturopsis crispa FD-325 SS-3]